MRRNHKGITLIELVIVLGIFGLLSTVVFSYLHSVLIYRYKYNAKIEAQQNARLAMHYIVKEFRKNSSLKCVRLTGTGWEAFVVLDQSNKFILDLRPGALAGTSRTPLYFERYRKELRRNVNYEHNVLIRGIKDIKLTRITESLIQVEIVAQDQSEKEQVNMVMEINLNKM